MAAKGNGLTRFFGQPVKGPAPPPPAEPLKELKVAAPAAFTPAKKRRTAPTNSPAKGPAATTAQATQQGSSNHAAKKSSGSPRIRKYKTKAVKAGAAATAKPSAKGGKLAKAKAKALAKKVRAMKAPKGRTAEWITLRRAGLSHPPSAYSMWCSDNRKRIQAVLGPSADFATVSKAVGEAWAKLSEEEKAPYKKRRAEAAAKYNEARVAYKEYAKDHAKLTRSAGAKGKRATQKGSGTQSGKVSSRGRKAKATPTAAPGRGTSGPTEAAAVPAAAGNSDPSAAADGPSAQPAAAVEVQAQGQDTDVCMRDAGEAAAAAFESVPGASDVSTEQGALPKPAAGPEVQSGEQPAVVPSGDASKDDAAASESIHGTSDKPSEQMSAPEPATATEAISGEHSADVPMRDDAVEDDAAAPKAACGSSGVAELAAGSEMQSRGAPMLDAAEDDAARADVPPEHKCVGECAPPETAEPQLEQEATKVAMPSETAPSHELPAESGSLQEVCDPVERQPTEQDRPAAGEEIVSDGAACPPVETQAEQKPTDEDGAPRPGAPSAPKSAESDVPRESEADEASSSAAEAGAGSGEACAPQVATDDLPPQQVHTEGSDAVAP